MSNDPSPVESFLDELQSAWLYRRVARNEPDAAKRHMFEELAVAAERQAEQWRREIETAQLTVPSFVPGLRAKLLARLIGRFSPRALRHALAAMKVRGLAVYRPELPDAGHERPTSVAEVGGRHHGVSGGNLRAAVFGANDGLVSNTSLILGVAGAAADPHIIVITGLAGWIAGALSMASGEFVSVRSQRELYEYQIGIERQELALYPEEEAQELALIYQARGMSANDAIDLATKITADPKQALDVLAREELGLNPDDLGSPWGAAVYSFCSFSAGAVVPVLPFLIGLGGAALGWSVTLAALALFGVGAALSLFTGRGAVLGGLRMLAIGGGAGAVTYGLGHLLGVAVS